MSAVEPNTSRILEQSVELKTKLLDVVGKHFTDAGDGAFCPEVALSALGSTVLDLFIYMQQLGAPPWVLNALAQAADAYLMRLSEQIAAVAAGKTVTKATVAVRVPRPASASAPEDGSA